MDRARSSGRDRNTAHNVRDGRILISLLAAVLCLCALVSDGRHAAHAQQSGTVRDTSLYKVSADHLRYTTIEGEHVVLLDGNVRIDHQTATITSKLGFHYQDKNFTELKDDVHALDGSMEMFSDIGEYYGEGMILVTRGNVRVLDGGWEILCDYARYDRVQRTALLTGNLSLRDSTRVMYADSIVYDRDSETAEALGNVVLIDEVGDYSIAGKHAWYNRSFGEAVVDIDPILTFDLSSEERGTIVAEWMRFDIVDKVGIAVNDVKLVKGETRAVCDSAAIFNEEGFVSLFGSPEAFNGRSGMMGDRMDIYYEEDEVRQIVIPAEGRLVENPAPGSPWRDDSWIIGDSVSIFLSDEKVDSVKIIGNSRAMYYPVEGEAGKVSNNFSAGDTMFFRFRNDLLNYVRMSGRAEGLYNFMTLAADQTIDSAAALIDTSLSYRDFKAYAEKVKYNAEVIEYFADTEDVLLHRNASLTYQNRTLSAQRVSFNSRVNVLEAVGDPVMEEVDQKMYGIDMGYHMEHEAGVVVDGSTKYGDGYYLGEYIFKVGDDVLKVYNSTYTTCDRKNPHYSMRSDRMKIYLKDKIVSGPITLYVGEVPIFYLPYMAASLRRDRHSGLLRPNFDFGLSSREGRFIRGLGYYWALNDYTDFLLSSDFNEKKSFRIHLKNLYRVRYLLNGNVRLNFYRNMQDYTNEWTINSIHNQDIGRTAKFNSDLRFVSSDNAQSSIDRAEDVSKIVDRRIYSSARFNKRWGGTSLNISAKRDQKLNVNPETPTVTKLSTTMPSVSLNFPRTSLWFGEKSLEGDRGIWERVLGSIVFTPRISANRRTEESLARRKETFSTGTGAGLSQSHKIGFISFNPSVRFDWDYFKVLSDEIDSAYAEYVPGGPDNRYVNEVSSRLSAQASTTFYGTFYPRIGPLAGVRHSLNPSVNYGFRPRLSENQVERHSVSYSLRNTFDLKVLRGGEEVKKSNVLVWNLSGSYDPQADQDVRFSRISSNITTQAVNFISFRMSHTYDPYEQKIVSQSLTAGLSLNLSGRFGYPAVWSIDEGEALRAAEDAADPKSHDPTRSRDKQNWTLSLGYNISQSGVDNNRRTDSNVRISGNIDLTTNWKVSYTAYYAVEAHEFREQQYRIERDLHCWRASFVHRKFGNEWSYYFQIAIKSHPEIMYERGPRGLQNVGQFW